MIEICRLAEREYVRVSFSPAAFCVTEEVSPKIGTGADNGFRAGGDASSCVKEEKDFARDEPVRAGSFD